MKKYIKIVVCAIAFLIVIVVVGIDLFENRFYLPKENLWNKPAENTPEEPEEVVITEEDKTYPMHEEVKITNEVYIDKIWTKHPLIFIVNGYEVTKTCPDNLPVIPDLAEYFGMDSKGTFTNNYSYVLVHLTIINDTDVDQEWWLNSFSLNLKDAQNINRMGDYEVNIYNDKERCNDKDYFFYIHPAHSRQEFTIGFFLTDEELLEAASMKLKIDHWGAGGEKPHNLERYVTLK